MARSQLPASNDGAILAEIIMSQKLRQRRGKKMQKPVPTSANRGTRPPSLVSQQNLKIVKAKKSNKLVQSLLSYHCFWVDRAH